MASLRGHMMAGETTIINAMIYLRTFMTLKFNISNYILDIRF